MGTENSIALFSVRPLVTAASDSALSAGKTTWGAGGTRPKCKPRAHVLCCVTPVQVCDVRVDMCSVKNPGTNTVFTVTFMSWRFVRKLLPCGFSSLFFFREIISEPFQNGITESLLLEPLGVKILKRKTFL